jgi:hypothetical protein
MPLDDRLKSLLTTALDDARQRLEAEFDGQFEAMRQEADRRLDEARAEAERVAAETRAEADRLLAEVREQARQQQEAAIHAAVTAARAEANEAARAMAERSRAETEALLEAAIAEASERALAERSEAMAAAGVREREAHMSGASRVLDAVRALDAASSLTEVLDRLTSAATQEAGRAAVLVLRGDRLHGWKLDGFGALDQSPRQVDLAVVDAGVIGAAVASGQPATTREGDGVGGPTFAALPADRMGLAVPVTVGGRVVAVVYADGARGLEHPVVPSPWPEMVELLARHAARCLEALTVQKVGNPAARTTPVPAAGRPA